MFRNTDIIFLFFFPFFTYAQDIVLPTQPSVWRSIDKSTAIYLNPKNNCEGFWGDCFFDADDKAFSGPHYPDPSENVYHFSGDTLLLYSCQSDVDDVVGIESVLRAVYVLHRQHSDTVWVEQVYPVRDLCKVLPLVRVATTCYVLSHYEYQYGWELLSDSIYTFIREVPSFALLPSAFADSVSGFCHALNVNGLIHCPVEMELHGTNVVLNAYAQMTDISTDYTAVCSIQGHMVYFLYDDFAFMLVQPQVDTMHISACERVIWYTNRFKKVVRDCHRTYSPPIWSTWFSLY